jgi:hypothetical protein
MNLLRRPYLLLRQLTYYCLALARGLLCGEDLSDLKALLYWRKAALLLVVAAVSSEVSQAHLAVLAGPQHTTLLVQIVEMVLLVQSKIHAWRAFHHRGFLQAFLPWGAHQCVCWLAALARRFRVPVLRDRVDFDSDSSLL